MINYLKQPLNFFILFCFLICCHQTFSQPSITRKDSLYRKLNKCKTDAERIESYYQVSELYVYNSADSCNFYGQKLLKLAKQTNSSYGEGLAYMAIGNGYFNHNDLTNTIRYYVYAQRLFEQIQPTPKQLPELYGILVTAYAELMDYKTAEEYGKKCLNLAEKVGDSATIVAVHNNIGDLLEKQNRHDEALTYYEESFKMAKSRKMDFSIGIAAYNLGHLNLLKKKDKIALPYLQEAIAVSKKIGDTEGVIYNYIDLGQISLNQKELTPAFLYADSALRLNKKYGNQKLQKETYFLLSNIYKAKGNMDSAYSCLQRATIMKDSIYNELSQKLSYNLTTNQEIQSLTSQALEREKDLNKQRVNNNILAIVGFIFFSVSFFLLMINYQRKKHTRLLEDKNKQIEAQTETLSSLNITKDKLISIISHDLRSPLNQIKVILQMFNDKSLSAEDFIIINQKLQKQVNTVSENLENVLNWAYLQMKGNQEQKEQIYVDTYIEQIVRLYESSLTEKKLDVKIDIPYKLNIFIEKENLKIALRNILGNAIKFSHQNATIDVIAGEVGSHSFIKIADTGTGMSREQIDNILVNNNTTSTLGTLNESGTGMGLRLSREFIEKSGGKIEISSELGKGSIFTILIPKHQPSMG